ncbi:DUF438 domain-containing protein [Paenibacillus sp. HN-1]|uniref:DUF438 domain-containing protein n=1 Tax=Paenibacillus TaxID=44249 RepID=UPI001CA9696B|nr:MULTISPECIES: DUF438 domain-containing protein [Paenibacillus]MBY9078964.1 DUF438 domain-containing protein [Paenibacillus sp. CGMCC 1.18879]MBY9084358.1 DUF438 domain-containing protein [Paenibacillus sinensis]
MYRYLNGVEAGAPRETRRKLLKEVVDELRAGKSAADVQQRFEQAVRGMHVSEISAMENELIAEEGVPAQDIGRLCAVHEAVFQGTVQEIHRFSGPEETPGHPVHTFKRENRDIERLVNFKLKLHAGKFLKQDSAANVQKLLDDLSLVSEIDRHYSRKESLLFPYIRKHQAYGKSSVMWGVDDHIRGLIKEVRAMLMPYRGNPAETAKAIYRLIREINDMIREEEQVLLPAALEKLTEKDWAVMAEDSGAIGYCLSEPEGVWEPDIKEDLSCEAAEEMPSTATQREDGTGARLPAERLELILKHLPGGLTFIDPDGSIVLTSGLGKYEYVSGGAGQENLLTDNRKGADDMAVRKLLKEFQSGLKDSGDFWIHTSDRFVHIRYAAVRDDSGQYAGALQFSQDIARLRGSGSRKRVPDRSESF